MAKKRRCDKGAAIHTVPFHSHALELKEMLKEDGIGRVWIVPHIHSSNKFKHERTDYDSGGYITKPIKYAGPYAIKVKYSKFELAKITIKRYTILKTLEGEL